jgi:hypothetical protein
MRYDALEHFKVSLDLIYFVEGFGLPPLGNEKEIESSSNLLSH